MHSRLKTVEGTYNLRDTGGYRTPTGSTRWGTLFRSDGLNRLTEAGLAEFEALGIGHVIDLRDDEERASSPDRVPAGVIEVAHSIFPSARAHVSDKMTIFDLTDGIYLNHADTLVPTLGLLADAPSPTLVHCTAGKDRTGAVIALALTAVGVDRDDVFHDYAATEENLRGEWVDWHLSALRRLGLEVTDEVHGLVASSPVDAIARAMQRIDAEYGSVNDYLAKHGADDAMLARLSGRLVS